MYYSISTATLKNDLGDMPITTFTELSYLDFIVESGRCDLLSFADSKGNTSWSRLLEIGTIKSSKNDLYIIDTIIKYRDLFVPNESEKSVNEALKFYENIF